MVWFELLLRWLFGLQFIFWGLNGFFHWKTIPPSSPVIENFTQACVSTGFIMPTIKFLEVLAGTLLISGFFVPLALTIFAPIVFVITFLHLIHNRKNGLPVLVTVSVPYLILLGFHGKNFIFFLQK